MPTEVMDCASINARHRSHGINRQNSHRWPVSPVSLAVLIYFFYFFLIVYFILLRHQPAEYTGNITIGANV